MADDNAAWLFMYEQSSMIDQNSKLQAEISSSKKLLYLTIDSEYPRFNQIKDAYLTNDGWIYKLYWSEDHPLTDYYLKLTYDKQQIRKLGRLENTQELIHLWINHK